MPRSTIEDLYYARRGTFETIPISETYDKLLNEIIVKEKILTKNFTKEQNDLFNDYCDLHGCLESDNCLTYYIEGFKIGLRVGIECMQEEKSE